MLLRGENVCENIDYYSRRANKNFSSDSFLDNKC